MPYNRPMAQDLASIRRYVRRLTARFKPQKVILFGSHARGLAKGSSDVDLLVILPFKGRAVDQEVKMRLALDRDFSLDLLATTPSQLQASLRAGDAFMTEIMAHGKVLYEKAA